MPCHSSQHTTNMMQSITCEHDTHSPSDSPCQYLSEAFCGVSRSLLPIAVLRAAEMPLYPAHHGLESNNNDTYYYLRCLCGCRGGCRHSQGCCQQMARWAPSHAATPFVLPAVVPLFLLGMPQHACDGTRAVCVRVCHLYPVSLCMAHQQ